MGGWQEECGHSITNCVVCVLMCGCRCVIFLRLGMGYKVSYIVVPAMPLTVWIRLKVTSHVLCISYCH